MKYNNVIQGTVRELKARYDGIPDDAILMDVRMGNHAGESLFYLLFERYVSMLETIFSMQATKAMDFDDFMLELDIRLYKDDCKAIRSFKSEKASFKTYLSTIARNILYDLREKELPVLDEDALESALYDRYDGEEVMMLVEEINNYPNKDSRYVLLKTIEGYKSKEIAAMLTSRRHEEGTLDEKVELKPSYIDTLRSRALKAIKNRIIGTNEFGVCLSMAYPSSKLDMEEAYMPEPPMAEKSMGAPMPPEEPLFVKAGIFISNIMDLYNLMRIA